MESKRKKGTYKGTNGYNNYPGENSRISKDNRRPITPIVSVRGARNSNMPEAGAPHPPDVTTCTGWHEPRTKNQPKRYENCG